jgi:hypothetical protein
MLNGQYRYQTFADGDGDGVKSTDIASGRERPASGKTRALATTTPACLSASCPVSAG